MSDLFGALGQAWPRLLLYPGGLSAVLAALIFARLRGVRRFATPTSAGLIDLLPPLSVMTLLPLAPAAPFPYGLDLLTALALLLWPALRRAAVERCDLLQLAAQSLPVLLAGCALASAVGTLDLSGLLRWPSTPARQVAFLLGTGAWLAAIPRLALPQPTLADASSALGLMLIGVLPLSASLSAILTAAPTGVVIAASVTLAAVGTVACQRLPARWVNLGAVAAVTATVGILLDI